GMWAWLEGEVGCAMRLAVAIDCARGVVMRPCMTSWVAPGYWVSTTMVALSMLGYSRTGRANRALPPTSRISRLTTADKIGRRMNKSVKRMSVLLPRGDLHGGAGRHAQLAFGDDHVAGPQAVGDDDAVADAPVHCHGHGFGRAGALRVGAADHQHAVAGRRYLHGGGRYD